MSPTKFSRGVPKQMGKISKNALLVAQEITFAKILSGNDPKVRERGIKRLQKWLTARSSSSCQFQESDLKRIWKGLFYCMWMSDKPLVQEEIAEHISNLVHCFQSTKSFVCFVKCFFLTVAVEWRGLDNWRMDKFLMFVRRFLRQVFVYIAQRGFPLKMIIELGSVFNSTILPDSAALSENLHPPLGFSIHFVDVYMDELTKVSKGKLNDDDLLVALLRPFVVYVSQAPEPAVANQIISQIFDRLIEQSEEGHKFREKFSAWKQLGFPRGNIDAVERVQTEDSDEEMEEDETEEEEEGVLDPRAGGVSVELPVADFNPEAVVNLLREYRHAKGSTTWSRKIIARVIGRFSAMTKGKYPLGIKKVDNVPKINFKKMAEKSAKELIDFQDRITYETDDEWMESLQAEKSKAPKRSTNSDEDDDSEGLSDGSEGSDEDVDEEDDDDLGDSSEVDTEDDNSVEVDGDTDGVDDQDIEDAENIDVESDEDELEDEDDLNGDVEDDGEELGSEEDEEVEAEEEPVKLSRKKKEKKMLVVEERPKKETPKNLPKVIPLGGKNKKQKNKQDTEKRSPLKGTPSVTPQKEALRITPLKGTPLSTPLKGTPKNPPKKETPLSTPSKGKQKHTPKMETPKRTPEVVSNGISKKQSKQRETTPSKKEETVIIVGRKRKLSDAIATPVIQRGKQFKNVQHSPRTPQTPGSAKKVQFILQRNTAQATSEYDRMLRENPGNPYDSAKKPRFSVLKTTPLASPVNPFYKP